MNSSIAERSTRIARAGAAVLPGVAEDRERRGGRGRLEVGVGEDHVGGLAAELEGDPLDRRGRALGDPAADLGRAGEGDLGDVGVLDEALGRRPSPGPATTLSTPSGSPASRAIFSSSSAVSGVSSAGLRTTVLPAASAGATFQEAIVEREVPGRDQADDAERLAEGHVDAAGDRDRLAGEALRGARRSSGRSRPPSPSRRGRPRSACPRCGPRASPAPRLAPRSRRPAGGAAQSARPGATARHAGNARLGALDRGVGLLDARAGHLRHHLLGGRLDHLDRVLARHEPTI